MDKPTHCSIDGCTSPALAKGLCNGHYKRQAETGTTIRPCPGCGNDLPVRKGIKYCSPACQPMCEVPGCDRAATAGASCQAHATRKLRTGSYERLCETCGMDIPIDSFAKRFCSAECRARRCSVEGCDKVAKGSRLCAAHYWRVRANGSADRDCVTCGEKLTIKLGQTIYCSKECHPKCSESGCGREIYRANLCDAHFTLSRPGTPSWIGSLKPRDFAKGCKSCGAERRVQSEFCSANCYMHYRRNGSTVAQHHRACKACGSTFSLLDSPVVKRRALTTALCLACKRRKNNYRKHAPELLAKAGGCCAICSEPIDLGLKFPNSKSMSIDHIIPWSMGGTDDPENLQVAHLSCNNQKQDRVGFKIA